MKIRLLILFIVAVGLTFTPFNHREVNQLLKRQVKLEKRSVSADKLPAKNA